MVKISRVEWAIIAFTIALVLILEGLNSAVEAAVDLSSPNFIPRQAAKDLAAAMVLIASLASLAVGLLILGPPFGTSSSRRVGIAHHLRRGGQCTLRCLRPNAPLRIQIHIALQTSTQSAAA